MKLSDFSFTLPEHLIAKYPTPDRTASRLLHLNGTTGDVNHKQFQQMLDLVEPGDLLVFNNTRVIPARLLGQKTSGGKVEVLIERIVDDNNALAHMRASKAPKPGTDLLLEGAVSVTVTGRQDALFELRFNGDATVLEQLEQYGHMPLPPYIDRPDEQADKERYQTVYNQAPGAVAAPTAGLHFDDALLERLQQKGVNLAYVTLHVGAGTFQPVRVDNILEHKMHSEFAIVLEDAHWNPLRLKQAKTRCWCRINLILTYSSIRGLSLRLWTPCLLTSTCRNPHCSCLSVPLRVKTMYCMHTSRLLNRNTVFIVTATVCLLKKRQTHDLCLIAGIIRPQLNIDRCIKAKFVAGGWFRQDNQHNAI